MSKAIMNEEVKSKWEPILENEAFAPIKDTYIKRCVRVLLENTAKEKNIDLNNFENLNEAGPINYSGDLASGTNIQSYDPVLISMIRRTAPQLIPYDVCGVQPMSGPTGLIFAMKSRYQTGGDNDLTDDPEALFNEARTGFSGAGEDGTVGTSTSSDKESDPAILMDDPAGDYTTGTGIATSVLEAMGSDGGESFNQMGLTIDKVPVTAKGRKLKAEFTRELEQDLQAIHGLDAKSELSRILSTEITSEINREVVRTIYIIAKVGGRNLETPGIFDMEVDANGRWSGEQFKGLLFQIEKEANAIARDTRRGRGNIILCNDDVASALAMAGVLQYSPALESNLDVDTSSTTFAGILNRKYKVYVDPYFVSDSGNNFATVGYKGASPYDAGLFYAPYVPLEMYTATGEESFQPRIAFSTRYGMVTNPFANASGTAGAIEANANKYYRKIKITNL